MHANRFAALARLANLKKTADLARLAQISARLQSVQNLYEQTETALDRQTDLAQRSPDPQLWHVLDAHAMLARQTLTRLAADIDRINAEREAQRQICAGSFGRAQVLDQIRDRQSRRPRTF
jgi:hypothetical protein